MVLLLFFPYKSPAPIYGLFPGLSNLLERADAVVVADIIEQADKRYIDGGVFKIRVRKVLKGEAAEDRVYSAYLRDLGFSFLTQSDLLAPLFSHKQTNSIEREFRRTQTNCPSLFPEGMNPAARGVFFLEKSNRAAPEVDFQGGNYEGDAFAVNPKADLKTLSGLKPREAIELLLKDSSAYHGERFPGYTAAVARMMGSP